MRERGLPVAYVAQDGATDASVPWGRFACLFLGGSTRWKLSPSARALVTLAKSRGLLAHIGRVNGNRRLRIAWDMRADSVDGTQFSMFGDTWIPRALRQLEAFDRQQVMFGEEHPMPCPVCLGYQVLMDLEKPPRCWKCGSAFDTTADTGDGRTTRTMAARKAAQADNRQTSIPGTEPPATAATPEEKPLSIPDAVKRVLELDQKRDAKIAAVERSMRAEIEANIARAAGKIRDKAKKAADAVLLRVPEAEREMADAVVRAARGAVARPDLVGGAPAPVEETEAEPAP